MDALNNYASSPILIICAALALVYVISRLLASPKNAKPARADLVPAYVRFERREEVIGERRLIATAARSRANERRNGDRRNGG